MEYADELWEELFTNGKDLNVRPGCPNQIERIESGLLSYGSDMTIQNSPFECGLGRFCEIDANSTCIGSEALENIAINGPSKVLRYFDIKGDKVPFCHDHWPIFNNKKVGEVTSGIFSTEFNTNVAIGIVDVDYAIEGTKLQVLIDNKLRDAFVKERPFNPKLKSFI
jgi:dimethylsulfoniopropionate demethylase